MDIKELKIPRKTERLKRFFNCIFYSDPHFTIDENLVDYKNQIEECKIPHLYPIPSVENFIHFIDNYDKSDWLPSEDEILALKQECKRVLVNKSLTAQISTRITELLLTIDYEYNLTNKKYETKGSYEPIVFDYDSVKKWTKANKKEKHD